MVQNNMAPLQHLTDPSSTQVSDVKHAMQNMNVSDSCCRWVMHAQFRPLLDPWTPFQQIQWS